MSNGADTLLNDITVYSEKPILRNEPIITVSQEKIKNQNKGKPFYQYSNLSPIFVKGESFCEGHSLVTYKVPVSSGSNNLNTTDVSYMSFVLPSEFNIISNAVLHIKFPAIGTETEGITTCYRYCEFPGVRIVKQARLLSAGTEVEKYTVDDAIMHYNNTGNGSTILDYPPLRKALGQEVTKIGRTETSGRYAQVVNYCDGPQTRRFAQPELEMFIPLLFFFSKDVSRALVKSNTSASQREIEIQFERSDRLLYGYSSPESDAVAFTVPNVNFSLVELIVDAYKLLKGPRDSVYLRSMEDRLIRERRGRSVIIQSPGGGTITLDKIRGEIESINVGFRSTYNVEDPDLWMSFGRSTRPNSGDGAEDIYAMFTYNDGVAPLPIVTSSIVYDVTGSTLDTNYQSQFWVEYKGNVIRVETHSKYFNTIPYIANGFGRGGFNDENIYTFNFNAAPGEDKVSGSINTSSLDNQLKLHFGDVGATSEHPVEIVLSYVLVNYITQPGDKVLKKYSI